MLVGMTGDVEDEASAFVAPTGADLAGLTGFALGAEAAASARALAASSFVPNREVKYDSIVLLSSAALAHLKAVQH